MFGRATIRLGIGPHSSVVDVVVAGKLYGVVLCCRPARHHVSVTTTGRHRSPAPGDRRSASMSGLRESTRRRRWSRLGRQRQSTPAEAAAAAALEVAVAGQAAAETTVDRASAPATASAAAARSSAERRQVAGRGCLPLSSDSVELREASI